MNRVVERPDHFVSAGGLKIKLDLHLHDGCEVRNLKEDLRATSQESCGGDFDLVVSHFGGVGNLVFL